MVSNLQMGPCSSQPLFKLLQGLALGSIMLANPLSVQSDPVGNNKIIQQQVNEDSSTIKILADKALALQKEGKYKEAAENWERFIGLVEKNFGPFYPDIVPSLNKLGDLYFLQGEYGKAEPPYIRSLVIKEKALGTEHPDVATSLNKLAGLYRVQGKYSKAEPLYVRALAINETALRPNHRDVTTSLNELALLYQDQGKYSKAEPLHIRALTIREKALGPDHPDVATSLNNLALLYDNQGKYSKAEPLYVRALAINKKALGPEHPDVATSLNNLAGLYKVQGKYSKAESLLIRALAINEKALGPDHPDVATSLNNISMLYSDQGKYSKVESLYVRALAIREKALGPDHPDVATSLNNLALLYDNQGKYINAGYNYMRSLAILQKVFGPDHPSVALGLNNLGLLYQKQSKLKKAESLYVRSLAIKEKALGPDHPDVAISLSSLASIHHEQGEYSKAESSALRSLSIWQKALGPNHPDVASGFHNLARLYQIQGKYSKAESLYSRALAIREKALGPDHPYVATSLNNIAMLSLFKSDYPKAIIKLRRGISIQSAWLNRELPFLPDQARSAQIKTMGSAWQIPFGITDKLPTARELALNTRLNRQGLLQEIQQRQALLLSTSGALKEKIQDLQSVIQQLSSVSLPQAKRAVLQEQRNLLQGDLYRELPNLAIEAVSISDVAKALPPDGVLVEFQKYQPFDIRKSRSKQWGNAQYLALVLKPNGSISSVNLGPAAAIDATIHRGLTATAQDFSDAPEIWAKLSKQVLQPLLPHLLGSKQWFLSLDGELNRVPFAAIPAPQKSGIPLAEAVQLRLLTTGRELLRLQKPNANSSAALVMANPSYNLQATAPATENSIAMPAENQRRSAAIDSKQWQPLPATEQEGSQIAALLSSPLISGTKATTTALLQQQGPKVLHIATHGFFVADQETKATNPLRAIQEDSFQVKGLRQEDPQLRSGLVLAGANQPTLDPNDDGYLTSAEALDLNLKGTELVVLSACSTGQGDVRTGEGVYGLQRSLTVAGARSTLLSLWKVDDAATAEFMLRFYKRLKAGDGRSDALAAVQKEFRDGAAGNGQWKEPYYWAAWQLVGDWKPIQGI